MSRSESESFSSQQHSRHTRPNVSSSTPQGQISPRLTQPDLSKDSRSRASVDPLDHVHDEESIRRIVNRLSRIEGHVRGVKRMVQEQENCPDVLVQLAAVRGAVDKVSRLILDEHLSQCIARAAQQGNIEKELAQLQAALNRFLPS